MKLGRESQQISQLAQAKARGDLATAAAAATASTASGAATAVTPLTNTIASLHNGDTITPASGYFVHIIVPQSGNVTGVILAQSFYTGQITQVVNTGSGSITFAASGTSFVADGVSDTIAGFTAAQFAWDQGTALWYRIK